MKVVIEDLNSDGDGVGSIEGKKVFVAGALPSETVEVQISEQKKRYDIGVLQEIDQQSLDRRSPICPYFGKCGGCQLMHLDYEAQLRWKRARIQRALKKIGGIDIEVAPCTPSPDQLRYRNKVHLKNGGFFKRGTHDTVPINQCFLVHEKIEKEFQKGDLKDLLVKYSYHENTTLSMEKGNANKRYLIEDIDGLKFKIRPKDFFQVNLKQAMNLYRKALLLANLTKESQVVDAFCGVGTLSLLASKHVKGVVGIELLKTAVESAKDNAKLNLVDNVRFIQGRVEENKKLFKNADAAFINPPRGGLVKELAYFFKKHPVKRLIYISCDPATLSRDLSILKESYQIESVHPFDMFPQTTHVETLVSLKVS